LLTMALNSECNLIPERKTAQYFLSHPLAWPLNAAAHTISAAFMLKTISPCWLHV
jgi:hypothetical protein